MPGPALAGPCWHEVPGQDSARAAQERCLRSPAQERRSHRSETAQQGSHMWCKRLPLWKESVPPASVLILIHPPTDTGYRLCAVSQVFSPASFLATSGSHSPAPKQAPPKPSQVCFSPLSFQIQWRMLRTTPLIHVPNATLGHIITFSFKSWNDLC